MGGEDAPHLGWVPQYGQYHGAGSAQPGKRVLDPLTHQGGSGRPNVVIDLGFVTPVTEALVSWSHFSTPGPMAAALEKLKVRGIALFQSMGLFLLASAANFH